MGGGDEFGGGGDLGEGAAVEPNVGVLDDAGEFFAIDVDEVGEFGFAGIAVSEAVDAAGGAVDAGVVVALASVGPVETIKGSFGAGADVEAAEPIVAREEGVGFVFADVATAFAFEFFDVQATTVLVPGEELAIPGAGEVAALVDAHADVGVASAEAVSGAISRFLPSAGGVEVPMVGVHLDGLVDEGVGGAAEGAVEVTAGNHVPEVAVDGVDEEEFAVLVPVVTPGVGGAVAEDFEGFACGVEAPNAATEGDAFRFGRAREADIPRAGATATAVEPAIGSPAEAVR